MPNLVKENPIGLDAVIHKFQVAVFGLKDKWNVTLNGYPRCYILEENGKKTIESYIGNLEYSRSLIFAEENKFFFVAGEREEESKDSKKYLETTIELFFIIDTTACYPNVLHKADQEVRVDVEELLWSMNEVEHLSIESNIDKVFNRYNNRISQGYGYEYTDEMTKSHCFKVLIKLKPYHYKTEYCQIK
jgi:hypothetical protein